MSYFSRFEIQPFTVLTWALLGLSLAVAACFFSLAAWTYSKLGLRQTEGNDVSHGFIFLRTAASVTEPHGFDNVFMDWSAGEAVGDFSTVWYCAIALHSFLN